MRASIDKDRDPGRAAGLRAATEDIANGEPRAMSMGELRREYDPDIGLPTATTGCELSDWSRGFCEGYNEAIGQAIKDGRICSLATKVRSVKALSELFGTLAPLRMESDSAEVVLAGGAWSLSVSVPEGEKAMWVCDDEHPSGAWLTNYFGLVLRRVSPPGGLASSIRCVRRALVLVLDQDTTLAVAHPSNSEGARFELFALSYRHAPKLM